MQQLCFLRHPERGVTARPVAVATPGVCSMSCFWTFDFLTVPNTRDQVANRGVGPSPAALSPSLQHEGAKNFPRDGRPGIQTALTFRAELCAIPRPCRRTSHGYVIPKWVPLQTSGMGLAVFRLTLWSLVLLRLQDGRWHKRFCAPNMRLVLRNFVMLSHQPVPFPTSRVTKGRIATGAYFLFHPWPAS